MKTTHAGSSGPAKRGWKRWWPGTAVVLGAGVAGWLAVSGRGPEPARGDVVAAVTVRSENVHIAGMASITAGPIISGSLQPERHATVRAEVGGAVMAMEVESGMHVREGTILARIDDAAFTDAVLAARSAIRTAEDAHAVAQRNAQRMAALYAEGAVALRDVEAATTSALSAEAQLDDARTAMAHARKQLERTVVRAPLTGVVSERPVAAGDIVQPGMALLTVVDPGSMRLEAALSSDQLASVRPGTRVDFRVRGYGERTFEGFVDRINPVVDRVTRQITIFVSIPNVDGPLVGGLYAEGRIATELREGVVLPGGVVQATSTGASVLRVRGGVVEAVPVLTGLVDARNERVEIASGVMAGDTLLTGAARTITPGTTVVIPSTPTAVASR